MTSSSDRLDGLRLVVARSAGTVAASADHFARLGAEVTRAVTSEITAAADGGAALRATLGRHEGGLLVVASAAALDAAIAAGADAGGWSVAAVGPSTARSADAAGFVVELTARPSTARVLVEMAMHSSRPAMVAPVVENEPSALVSAIAELGAADRIETVPAYRNERRRPDLSAEELLGADLVAVFSPSAVRSLAAIGPATRALAIGPTTAAAAIDWLSPDRVVVAAEHDLDGMARAARAWWASHDDVGSGA